MPPCVEEAAVRCRIAGAEAGWSAFYLDHSLSAPPPHLRRPPVKQQSRRFARFVAAVGPRHLSSPGGTWGLACVGDLRCSVGQREHEVEILAGIKFVLALCVALPSRFWCA